MTPNKVLINPNWWNMRRRKITNMKRLNMRFQSKWMIIKSMTFLNSSHVKLLGTLSKLKVGRSWFSKVFMPYFAFGSTFFREFLLKCKWILCHIKWWGSIYLIFTLLVSSLFYLFIFINTWHTWCTIYMLWVFVCKIILNW